MAILSNLIVHGSGRILNKLYVTDLEVGGTTTFNSITTGTLTTTGASTFGGESTFSNHVNIADDKTLYLLNDTDATMTGVQNVALVIGPKTGTHIEVDNNEIIAKSNASTASTFYINTQGGAVILSGTPSGGAQVKANNGTLSANTISATTGSITGNLNAGTGAFTNVVANNVNVIDTLRATRYDIQTISQTGGSLYISPTIRFPNSNTSINVNYSSTQLKITISDPDSISAKMAGISWVAGAEIICSGTVGDAYFRNTEGTISSINTTSKVLTLLLKTNVDNFSALSGSKTYSGSQIKDFSVAVLRTKVSGNMYRVGLWMSCYDIVNNSAAIRIYGGTSNGTPGESLDVPNVYLGNMTNAQLPSVQDSTPTGWGLYADNAYLKGVIYSTEGLIGGWTLGATSLYSGTYGGDNSAYFSTANLAKKAIGGREGADWRVTVGSHLGITNTGALYCNSATIAGTITANEGSIAGFHITASDGSAKTSADGGHAYTYSMYRHSGNGITYEYEIGMHGSATENPSSTNTTTGNLAFYVTRIPKGATWASGNRKNVFSITHSGHLYAESAEIKGKITATSGDIGGCAITDQQLVVDSAHISNLSGDKIIAHSINATKMVLSDPTNYITVNESDPSTALPSKVGDVYIHSFGTGASVCVTVKVNNVDTNYIAKQTASASYIALSAFTVNSFQENDELYYSLNIKGATSGGKCSIRIYFYDKSASSSTGYAHVANVGGSVINFTTTETTYTGTIQITKAVAETNAGYYAIGLNDASDTKAQIYIREASLRKKSGANLIVDGAITANKIAAGAITADKIATNSLTVGGRNILRGTQNLKAVSSNGTWVLGQFRSSGSVYNTSFKNIAINDSPVQGISQGILLTADADHLTPGFCQDGYKMQGHINDVLTFSVWVKVSKANSKVRLQPYFFKDSSTNTTWASTSDITVSTANKWTKISFTSAKITRDFDSITIGYIYLYQASAGDTLTVCAPMLEWGIIASDWTPSPDEIAGFTIDATAIHTSNVAVTSNANNSIGFSSVNFTRTINGTSHNDLRLAIGSNFGVTGTGKIYASDVDLTGKITATSGEIGGCSISNGNLIVSSANVSGALHIGGSSNLLINAQTPVTNTSYNIKNYQLVADSKPIHGDIVTIQLKGSLGAGKTQWGIYNSGGQIGMAYLYDTDYDETTGIYSKTFTWLTTAGSNTANNTYLYVYAMPNSVTGVNSTIEWIKVEKGNQATGWDNIAGFTIDNTSIRSAPLTSSTDNAIGLSTADFTRSINGTSRSGLRLAIGDKFGVTGDGIVYASSADISGKITATSGKIGNFNISTTADTNATSGHYYSTSLWTQVTKSNDTKVRYEAGINSSGDQNAAVFYVRQNTDTGTWTSSNGGWNWYVRKDGYMYAKSGSIAGWGLTTTDFYNVTGVTAGTASTQYGTYITKPSSSTTQVFRAGSRSYDGSNYGSWSWETYITAGGALHSTSADIQGKITATSGFIGNGNNKITLGDGKIYYGVTSMSDKSHNGFYLGYDGIKLGKGVFSVSKEGLMTATNVNITGGTIGGCTFKDGVLQVGSANVDLNLTVTDLYAYSSKIGGITINTDGISATSASGSFTISKSGKISCSGATISGEITANSGTIGGCTIDSKGLLQVPIAQVTGTITATNIEATNGSIGGITISSNSISASGTSTNSPSFTLSSDGKLSCSGAEISGDITATSFTLSGSDIDLGQWIDDVDQRLFESSGDYLTIDDAANTYQPLPATSYFITAAQALDWFSPPKNEQWTTVTYCNNHYVQKSNAEISGDLSVSGIFM